MKCDNHPDVFPELRLVTLQAFARELATYLQAEREIPAPQKITLFHATDSKRHSFDPDGRYLLELIVPEMAKSPSIEEQIRRFHLGMLSSYRRLRPWAEILASAYVMHEVPYHKGFRFMNEWRFQFVPEAEDRGEKNCWLLYEGEQPAIKSTELPFPCDPGTTWDQVTFILKGDDLVYVKTPKGEARVRYDSLKFADRRRGDKPKEIWRIFELFAKQSGEISRENPQYDRYLADKASDLNKHMQKVFSIKESIFTGHYRKMRQYKTRFAIRDERMTP